MAKIPIKIMKTLFRFILENNVGVVSKKRRKQIKIVAYPSIPKKL